MPAPTSSAKAGARRRIGRGARRRLCGGPSVGALAAAAMSTPSSEMTQTCLTGAGLTIAAGCRSSGASSSSLPELLLRRRRRGSRDVSAGTSARSRGQRRRRPRRLDVVGLRAAPDRAAVGGRRRAGAARGADPATYTRPGGGALGPGHDRGAEQRAERQHAGGGDGGDARAPERQRGRRQRRPTPAASRPARGTSARVAVPARARERIEPRRRPGGRRTPGSTADRPRAAPRTSRRARRARAASGRSGSSEVVIRG